MITITTNKKNRSVKYKCKMQPIYMIKDLCNDYLRSLGGTDLRTLFTPFANVITLKVNCGLTAL